MIGVVDHLDSVCSLDFAGSRQSRRKYGCGICKNLASNSSTMVCIPFFSIHRQTIYPGGHTYMKRYRSNIYHTQTRPFILQCSPVTRENTLSEWNLRPIEIESIEKSRFFASQNTLELLKSPVQITLKTAKPRHQRHHNIHLAININNINPI